MYIDIYSGENRHLYVSVIMNSTVYYEFHLMKRKKSFINIKNLKMKMNVENKILTLLHAHVQTMYSFNI